MKRVLFSVFIILMCLALPANATNMNKYSDNGKIISALNVLENINETEVFTRLDKGNVKIMFYDLSLIDYSYAKHFAVSSTDENGNNVILINEKYQGAPKEAIASLIAHESVHILPNATLNEEVQATTTEARTWLKVRDNVSTSQMNNELVKREDKLASLYKASTSDKNEIKISISNNSFYKQQLLFNN